MLCSCTTLLARLGVTRGHARDVQGLKNIVGGNYASFAKKSVTTSSAEGSERTTSDEDPGKPSIGLGHWWHDPIRNGIRLWRIHNYGGPSELMPDQKNYPRIQSPYDVTISISAASINPIDLAMSRGYGAELLNTLRDVESEKGITAIPKRMGALLRKITNPQPATIEFPITLGRDFAGEVTEIGYGVSGSLKIGDQVWGVLPPYYQGSLSDCIIGPAHYVRKKPRNLSFTQAASIPYVGLTAWSAIKVTGGYTNVEGKRFFVIGASGGVGTFAVQYLKALGATVFASCSNDAIPLVEGLGADVVLDYKQPDHFEQLVKISPFDCILDVSGHDLTRRVLPKDPDLAKLEEERDILKTLRPIHGQYITLSPPLLRNMDAHGFVGGSLKSASQLLFSNVESVRRERVLTKWAFFIPNGDALDEIARFVEDGKIIPVVEKVFPFTKVPDAFNKLDQGHSRGKLVIRMDDPEDN